MLVVVACGGDSDSDSDAGGTTAAADSGGETVNIAHFGGAAANSYWQTVWESFQGKAEEMGGEATFIDSNFDADKQYAQIQDAITSGKYDAFSIVPLNRQAIRPLIEEAIAKGIAVNGVNFPMGDDLATPDCGVEGATGCVLKPARSDGQDIADLIVAACEGVDPCKVAHLAGDRSLEFDAEKIDAIKDTIADHPNIELVAVQDGDYLRDPSFQAARSILQANPDIKVFSSGADQMTLGIEQAAEELDIDGIKFIGSAASESGVKAVREGRWFGTTLQLPKVEGTVGAEMAVKGARKEAVKDKAVDPTDLTPIGGIVTKETLEKDPDFEAQWEG